MTTGALLFAFDSEIKYTKLAIECTKRIQKYLDIPVTLITDSKLDTDIFDQQIIVDKPNDINKRYWHDRKDTTTWFNFGRNSALSHTPYDRTLLIDTDYMLNSADLLPMLQSSQPFLCHKHMQNINSSKSEIQTFGVKNTQMWWATVVIFDQSEFSQDVFSAWRMIEQNYQHYANMFGFNSSQFRNDYALSLALLLCNGNTIPTQCEIPWPLFNVEPDIKVSKVNDTWWMEYNMYERGEIRPKKISVTNHDLHILGKSYLEKIYAL